MAEKYPVRASTEKIAGHTIVPIPTVTGRVHLVEGESGSALVDALTTRFSRTVLNAVRQRENGQPGRVRLILISHAHIDHFSGALRLREELGAPIAIHEMDADDLRRGRNGALYCRNLRERLLKFSVSRMKSQPIEPDVVLRGEEGDLGEWGIEAKWVRTPGHTEGSISVVFPGEMAIVGDLVIGRFGVSRKPAYPFWVRDAGQLRESVKRVLDLSPRVLLSGHGGPFSAEDVKRVFFG